MKFLLILAAALFLIASPSRAQFNEAATGAAPTYVISQVKAAPNGTSSLVSISPAFADFLHPYIDSTVNALILAFITWGFAWFRQHAGLQIDQKHRDALVVALQNQAGSLIADGMVRMENGKVDVHSQALASAAQEVMRVIPATVKQFGITPEFVSQRIVDTIPQIEAGARMIADAVSSKAKMNETLP